MDVSHLTRVRYHITTSGWVKGAVSYLNRIEDCDDPRPVGAVATYEEHQTIDSRGVAGIHACYEVWRLKGATDADLDKLFMRYGKDRAYVR